MILALDRTPTGAETIDALRGQASDVPLELVLVGIDGRAPEPPEASSDFAAVRLVASAGRALPARAGRRRESVNHALRGHCRDAQLPAAGLGARHGRRLSEGWVGVGPAIEPGNPARRAVALTVFDYGRWMGGPPGPWPDLPGHNSAYRRAALLDALERFPAGTGGGDPHAR